MAYLKLCATIALLLNYTCATTDANMDKFRTELKEVKGRLQQLEDQVLEVDEKSSLTRPANCLEAKHGGHSTSGIYKIYPRFWYKQEPFDVYCDMETDGGGWTVIQRRDDYGNNGENFFRSWNCYKDGFGQLNRDHWLGNEHIAVLTNQDQVTLRIELEDFENETRLANYATFQVAFSEKKYLLTVGGYNGDAGDAFSGHTDHPFTTYDNDSGHKCAIKFKGGWWYTNCHTSNLNGIYHRGQHESHADGVNWKEWKGYKYSLKRTEMKIRPRYAECSNPIPT